MVRSYLSPTPVGVGVGTSFIWAVDQTLLSGESLATRDYSERGAETPEEREMRNEVQRYSTLKEAIEDVMEYHFQFPCKTVTHILFIHTCPFLAQQGVDPKDLEHHAARKLLI